MEILETTKGKTREGYDVFYITVRSTKDDYSCSITLNEGKVVKCGCTCAHAVWEISKTNKSNKNCRHVKLALEELNEINKFTK